MNSFFTLSSPSDLQMRGILLTGGTGSCRPCMAEWILKTAYVAGLQTLRFAYAAFLVLSGVEIAALSASLLSNLHES